jgi:outer membrane protein OmpA-like peptidoglycan-associated protein
MRNSISLSTIAAAAVLTGACSTTPERVAELDAARSAVASVRQDPQVERYAGSELQKAEAALDRAEQSYNDGDDLTDIVHEAHMAQGYADIAAARMAERSARENIEDAELERARVVEQVRTEEARAARNQLEEARLQADMANERADQLQSELADLHAKETERGIVLTLGDVLFDTAEADLKPGADKTIMRLASFLNEHPDRNLLIEGHTDSRGTESFNQDLSQRRANSVRDALVAAGVQSDRLKALGLGEDYPVATNETASGRQENRRVEVVVSSGDEAGFPAPTGTTASRS